MNKNNEIDLDEYLGWYVIINREHNDNVTLAENIEISNNWFENNIINQIPDSLREKEQITSCLGTINLANKLILENNKFIVNKLFPDVNDSLLENIATNKLELKKLGIEPSDIYYNEFISFYKNHVVNKYIKNMINIDITFDVKEYHTHYNFDKYMEDICEYIRCLDINSDEVSIHLDNIPIMEDTSSSLNIDEILLQQQFVPWRFVEINNDIKKLLIKQFINKMTNYVNVAEGHIMMHLFNNDNKNIKYDFHTIKNGVINEMLHNNVIEDYQFDLKESDEFINKRNNLNNTIHNSEKAYEQLLIMSDKLNLFINDDFEIK